ncbi:MAG: hypothetical protein II949_13865 [Prevotella sp.]|nr:hypothetical protein [Prevotella sp.]
MTLVASHEMAGTQGWGSERAVGTRQGWMLSRTYGTLVYRRFIPAISWLATIV